LLVFGRLEVNDCLQVVINLPVEFEGWMEIQR